MSQVTVDSGLHPEPDHRMPFRKLLTAEASPLFLMVEVFKTNVTAPSHAQRLLAQIHATFREYRANFDLEDADRILRVECPSGFVLPSGLIRLLHDAGFRAEVLPDDC